MFLKELQQLEIFEFHNFMIRKIILQLFSTFCVI